jgi:hypothetical protein
VAEQLLEYMERKAAGRFNKVFEPEYCPRRWSPWHRGRARPGTAAGRSTGGGCPSIAAQCSPANRRAAPEHARLPHCSVHIGGAA